MIRFFNFIRTHKCNRFTWSYFYTLFLYKGNKVIRLMEIRIKELENARL